MIVCQGYGLTITSDFPLPGAVPSALPADRADFFIRQAAADLIDHDEERGPYRRAGAKLLLDAPGLARLLFHGPGQLAVAPYPAAARQDVAELIVATGLPMLLWALSGVVLHASGVVLPGRPGAVAIAGSSGSGKSTLADRLLDQGAGLVGDDTLWLPKEGEARGLHGGRFLARRDGDGRTWVPTEAAMQVAAAPLAAVVVLARTAGEAPPLQRLGAIAALSALLNHRHRPKIPALLGCEPRNLEQLAALAAKVPVYRLALAEGQIAEAAAAIMTLP